MIEDSTTYLRGEGRKVIYDAEHFFDGYKDDAPYALETLNAALRGGAECLVLCDTNGGTLPSELALIVREVRAALPEARVGIHPHNDSGVAVANALTAVEEGCVHVQGTFTGLGERCGNADLVPIIANLVLKLDCELSITEEKLKGLSHAARYVHALANLSYPRTNPTSARWHSRTRAAFTSTACEKSRTLTNISSPRRLVTNVVS